MSILIIYIIVSGLNQEKQILNIHHIKMNPLLGFLIALIFLVDTSNAALNDVIVEDLKIFVEGEEYFIKGMCYNPVPLGEPYDGGFCSLRLTPWGSEESACYDSDFFDGRVSSPYRKPPGPKGPWFQPLWERDFPLMRQLGVNTIRIYNANPTTLQASIDQLGKYGIVDPTGSYHIPFLNMALEYNFRVIFPLVGDETLLLNTDNATYNRWLMNQIDEVGNHSAILMFALGNELDVAYDPQMLDLVNEKIQFSRNYLKEKWGRKVPITDAVVDLPSSYPMLAKALDVDVFTSNAGYRGFGFSDLWSGSGTLPGWFNLSCTYNKPLFIGEMGFLSINNSIDYSVPNWFNQQFHALISNIPYGCVGGAFFEYNDEIYKASPLQQHLGVVSVSVNSSGGCTSLQPNCWNADIVTRKPILFNSMLNGTDDGQPFNYHANVFSYLCRERLTLADVKPGSTCAKAYGNVTYCNVTLETNATAFPEFNSSGGVSADNISSSGSIGLFPLLFSWIIFTIILTTYLELGTLPSNRKQYQN